MWIGRNIYGILNNQNWLSVGIEHLQLVMSFLFFSLISSRISLGTHFLPDFLARLREFPMTTMINDIYGFLCQLLNGKLPRAWFLSCSIMYRYSKQGEDWEECCICQLLNSKKNNGRDALWCSSMGNSPSLVNILSNCVYILLSQGGDSEEYIAFASSSIARKTMVEMLYGAP